MGRSVSPRPRWGKLLAPQSLGKEDLVRFISGSCAKGKVEVAQNSLRLGMAPQVVAQITGMSLAAVEQLQRELE